MSESTGNTEAAAQAAVAAALAHAGLRASPEQAARMVTAYRHMQQRLALLRQALDPSVPPVLVFPAAALAELEHPDGV